MIKDRVIQAIENKGIAKESFYAKIGMTSANFRGKAKSTPLNSTAIENILSEIPDLNANWLLTGKGDMLNTPSPRSSEREDALIAYKSKEGIPLIPIDAMAGALTENSRSIMDYDCEHYVIPMFKGAEFLIPVKGDSMQPKYYSGDIVACKRLPLDTFFQWNRTYVIDSEQGVLIKRVKQGEDNEHITLVSDNPEYDPFSLEKSRIYSLALVIGVVRAE